MTSQIFTVDSDDTTVEAKATKDVPVIHLSILQVKHRYLQLRVDLEVAPSARLGMIQRKSRRQSQTKKEISSCLFFTFLLDKTADVIDGEKSPLAILP